MREEVGVGVRVGVEGGAAAAAAAAAGVLGLFHNRRKQS